MMTFTDRLPAEGKENRFKITKSDGTVEYVKLERADEANPIGTPLNKTTFENMQKELTPVFGTYTGNGEPSGKYVILGFKPKALLIFEHWYMSGPLPSSWGADGYGIVYIENVTTDKTIPIQIQDKGFVPRYNFGSSSNPDRSSMKSINSDGIDYYYIAFR